MNPPEHAHNHPRLSINTNTGVSVGIIVLMFAGFWAVMNGISSMKSDIKDNKNDAQLQISAVKSELSGEIKEVKARVIAMESNHAGVTGTEFFKWAVHLQQANPQIKVPEPEVNTK